MKLDLDRIECRSAFDIAPDGIAIHQLRGSGSRADLSIRTVQLSGVLYLPGILEPGQSICLVEQRFVPEESILDCFAVDFVKRARIDSPEHRHKYGNEVEPRVFSGTVCILGNLFSRNFGHWTEELLKVAILERAGQDCYYVIPPLPPFARAFLLLLGIDESRIVEIDVPTVFERTVFTTGISHGNISTYPWALARLRELVEAGLGSGTSQYGPRLWLERMAMLQNGGMTQNRDEVYRCIQAYDFDVVDLATLSVADQLRTIRGATTIAGPHGSQFVHAQFMPMGSTVIECFSPIHVNPSILQICRVLKHRYHQIVARSHVTKPYPHGRDCYVDCECLALILDSAL